MKRIFLGIAIFIILIIATFLIYDSAVNAQFEISSARWNNQSYNITINSQGDYSCFFVPDDNQFRKIPTQKIIMGSQDIEVKQTWMVNSKDNQIKVCCMDYDKRFSRNCKIIDLPAYLS